MMGQDVRRHFKQLARTARYTPEEYRKYKLIKIEELLCAARKGSNFYQGLQQNVTPNDSDVENLHNIKILTKEIIRDNIKEFIAPGLRHYWRSTSGTTGSPLRFPKDTNASSYMDAMMYLAYSWHGIGIGEKQARFWGRPVYGKAQYIQMVKDMLLNRIRLSAFDLTEENCLCFFRRIKKFRPKFFYGYSNALYLFTSMLASHSVDGKSLGLKVIIATGEVLFSYQRQAIQDFFGCKVINEYGTTENGIIGFECEFGKMHEMPTIHLEVTDQDENGVGEFLISELNSRSIPFIRYKTGDKGRITTETCSCNRPYRVIELFEGRTGDFIVCPNGKSVYSSVLPYTFKGYFQQFKAFQESDHSLKILYIPRGDFSGEAENCLRDTLHQNLSPQIQIDFIEVGAIPLDSTGKMRYFVGLSDKRVL